MIDLLYIASGCNDYEAFFTLNTGYKINDETICTIVDYMQDECDYRVSKILTYVGTEMYHVAYNLRFGKTIRLTTIDLDEY